jgi:hypothetical protein
MLTADLSDGFFDAVRTTSETLGCTPMDLLGVMMNESGVKATAHNANGDASGLIQFMPKTLENLGWTQGHELFRQLSAEEQMPYVEAYFRPYVSQGLSPAARLYQATFLPATLSLGSSLDTVICERDGRNAFAYGPNQGFDREQKGYITVGDLQAAIDRACHGARWDEISSRLNGTFVEGAIDLSTTSGVQEALTALGYDPGPVDGVWGPRTQAAVQKFESDQGLAESDGQVGPETRAALAAGLDAQGLAHVGE